MMHQQTETRKLITRRPAVRRDTVNLHWVRGVNASITVGTENVQVPVGETKQIDVGGLLITFHLPEDEHVLQV